MKIEMKSTGGTILELMIKALCREVALYTDCLHSATSQITGQIASMTGSNSIVPAHAYKAILAEDLKQVEVWHYSPAGDRDRLVLTLTK